MRRFRKADKKAVPEASPDDTQEMFTAGQSLPEESDETREYETVALAREGDLAEAEPDESTEVLELEDEEPLEAIEEEAWEGDEYEEWEEEPAEDEQFEDDAGEVPEDDEEVPEEGDEAAIAAAAEGEAEKGSDFLADLKVWFEDFRKRAGALWSRLLKRVGDTKLPRHEVDGQKVLAAAGIVVIALLVAAGGYLLGKGSGDDLDTARLEGEFAGRKAGAVAGATQGYAAGFKKGRDLAFRKAYSASYKRNYRRAYESAGMDPPKPENIQVPEP